MRRFRAAVSLLALPAPLAPAAPQERPTPKQAAKELAELAADDQRDQDAMGGDEAAFAARQGQRRARVLEILGATELEDPAAHADAALLLLHGSVPGDYLLAHVLSIPAGLGSTPFGRFQTAAALDRFLVNIQREQIFGTQSFTDSPDPPAYDTYPAHFVPEHLRRIFQAGPPLRVRMPPEKRRDKPPSAKELRELARDAASAAPESLAPEIAARVRAAVFENERLQPADHLAAARTLARSAAADDLLLAHVCAVAAAFEANKKERDEALAECARTLDLFLASVDQTPRFVVPPDASPPEPPLPDWLKAALLGK